VASVQSVEFVEYLFEFHTRWTRVLEVALHKDSLFETVLSSVGSLACVGSRCTRCMCPLWVESLALVAGFLLGVADLPCS
jgi:hypothetical protein